MNLKCLIIQLRNNRDGYAWYLGTFIMIAMLGLTFCFLQKWEANIAVETIEDMTTASALGAMEINVQQYSLFGDTVFSSDTGSGVTSNINKNGRVASPDKCFEKLQDLVGANLNLTRTAGTCSYSGKSNLLDTETSPLTIKKAIFYNWYTSDGFVESYTYTELAGGRGYTCTYQANESNFPTGATMDNSGLYIEVEIPLKCLGISSDTSEFLTHHTTITKGQWTAAKFN